MIAKYIETLKEKETERKIAIKSLNGWVNKQKENKQKLVHLESARSIIQRAAQITQQQLSIHISKTVSVALAAVFDDTYEFIVEFVERRNTTECDLLFKKNDKTMKPLDSCGYGIADIVSLALRIAFWKLDGTARNLCIMDEPFRNLSIDKQPLASMMLKKLSEKLNLQFVIVTHNSALMESADKCFEVTNSNGTSELMEV